MTPDSWIIIGTGPVIEIAASNHRLRGEIKELRERMTKVEGLLEGLREAISGHYVA